MAAGVPLGSSEPMTRGREHSESVMGVGVDSEQRRAAGRSPPDATGEPRSESALGLPERQQAPVPKILTAPPTATSSFAHPTGCCCRPSRSLVYPTPFTEAPRSSATTMASRERAHSRASSRSPPQASVGQLPALNTPAIFLSQINPKSSVFTSSGAW